MVSKYQKPELEIIILSTIEETNLSGDGNEGSFGNGELPEGWG